MRPTDSTADILHTAGGRLPSGEEYTLCGLIESSPGIWIRDMEFPRPKDLPICVECNRLDA